MLYGTNQRTRIYTIGGAYTSGTIWVGTPASCTMTTTATAYTFHTVGSEVPASTFVAGSIDTAP